MNEAETRAEHIDPALKSAGWGVVEESRIFREYPITLGRLQLGGVRSKPDIADYVLVYKNHKLAVVEAKRWDLPYTEGVLQPKQYAQNWGSVTHTPPMAKLSMASTWKKGKKEMLPIIPLLKNSGT